MTLGELIDRLERADDDGIAQRFLAGDLVRLARARAAAGDSGQSLAAYVRTAVTAFLDRASEEELTGAMGLMHDDPAPGDRLVERALDWHAGRKDA